MSNFFMLVSDRPIKSNLIKKEIDVPKSISKELVFNAKYAYIVEPIANDRKEGFVKDIAPELYYETTIWFKKLKEALKTVLENKGNIVIIETYYDQDLDDIIWLCENFPINNFDKSELVFEFETIYAIEL